MKKFLALLIVSCVLLSSAFAWAACEDDPQDCFEEPDENGEVKPKDDRINRLYDFPPVKGGFIFDLSTMDIEPQLSIEATNFSLWGEDFALDAGVASNRLFGSLTWEFLPIVKVGPSIWVGYNFEETGVAYGLGFSFLSF